jgi:hypothetical protein
MLIYRFVLRHVGEVRRLNCLLHPIGIGNGELVDFAWSDLHFESTHLAIGSYNIWQLLKNDRIVVGSAWPAFNWVVCLVVATFQAQIWVLNSHQTDVASLPRFLLCASNYVLILTAVERRYPIWSGKNSKLVAVQRLVSNATPFQLANCLWPQLVVS